MKKSWKFQEEKLPLVLSVIALFKKPSLLLVYILFVEDVFSQVYIQNGRHFMNKVYSKREKSWLIFNQFVPIVRILSA